MIFFVKVLAHFIQLVSRIMKTTVMEATYKIFANTATIVKNVSRFSEFIEFICLYTLIIRYL